MDDSIYMLTVLHVHCMRWIHRVRILPYLGSKYHDEWCRHILVRKILAAQNEAKINDGKCTQVKCGVNSVLSDGRA